MTITEKKKKKKRLCFSSIITCRVLEQIKKEGNLKPMHSYASI
jgi:hypothetical protein